MTRKEAKSIRRYYHQQYIPKTLRTHGIPKNHICRYAGIFPITTEDIRTLEDGYTYYHDTETKSRHS